MPALTNLGSKITLFLKGYALFAVLLFLVCLSAGSFYLGAFFERSYLIAVQTVVQDHSSAMLYSRAQIYVKDREWVKQADAASILKRAVEIMDTDESLVGCIVAMRMLQGLPENMVSAQLRTRLARTFIRQCLLDSARWRSQSILVPFPTNEWKSVARLSKLLAQLENCKDAKELAVFTGNIKDSDTSLAHGSIETVVKWASS